MSIELTALLQYPYDGGRSPFEQEIEAIISQWIDEYPFLSGEQRQYYKKCRFGMITSCFYPNISYKAMQAAARLMLLLFVHDDYTDNFTAQELRSFTFQSESIMSGHPMPHDSAGILHQFVLLRKEFEAVASREWLQRWHYHLNYFYEGMVIERYFIKANASPSIQHYMFIREHLIGMYIFQDIIELYLPSFLPFWILSHPYTRQLRQLNARIIAWCNDFFSAAKEAKAGQAMNLVLVVQKEWRCTLEEAYREVARIHNEEIKLFYELTENPPDFGPWNEVFKQYIDNLQIMFRGNYWWHIKSGRYNTVKE